MARTGRIMIGTSGWRYDHWWGPFYPEEVSPELSLAHYAGRLPAVEVNRTFYGLPSTDAVRRWRWGVPSSFRFAVKASRFITHMKKLREPEESLDRLYQVVGALGETAGPVLFQLPPRWRCNPDRLAAFLEAVPPSHRIAFEFRDRSWFDDRVLELLGSHRAAFCIWDLAGEQSPREVTTDLVYVRLHGPGRTAYTGSYDRRTLSDWAGACDAWASSGRDVWCFFDNDEGGNAVRDAGRLLDMLDG
jgi:uncharacterized protein YecE (DUF72 family)